MIYKICPARAWAQAVEQRSYTGSADDVRDGFIHFSGAAQVAGTLAKYYAGANDLVLVAVDDTALGAALKWESSRDGQLFPHLYGMLETARAVWVKPLTKDETGGFVLPTELGE